MEHGCCLVHSIHSILRSQASLDACKWEKKDFCFLVSHHHLDNANQVEKIHLRSMVMLKLAATGSQNHGLDWVWRDFKAHLIPHPCHGQRHLPLDQVSPSLIPSSKDEQYRKVFRVLYNHSQVHDHSTSDATPSATALTQRPLGAAPRDQITPFPEFTATETSAEQNILIF